GGCAGCPDPRFWERATGPLTISDHRWLSYSRKRTGSRTRTMTSTKFRTLTDVATFHAAHHPAQIALICDGNKLTFRQLHLESNRLARAIAASGVARAARVAYLGLESERYYELVFACAKSGTVLVPINWRLTAPEIDHILRDSGAELLFVEHG